MQITEEDIKNYKKVFKDKFWYTISDKEALIQCTALVDLVKTILFFNDKIDE